ncbi:hypothetical protein BG006_002523 [Podila minutissima]|uniref:Glutathione S-transferase n=1 Tax=Podila minutissima TaxID=64525 RepID=A0A9P5SW84_9FUNG|nr:hypothetical protein BG006_002523 [Podila minutissima]
MVNSHTTLPTPTLNLSTQELSTALEAKDNTFQFYYFNVHTHGATGRALLAYADYEKALTKFGSLPLVYEATADGSVVVEHAEAISIEIYLAEKFVLLSTNAFERSQILGFFSSTRATMHRHEDAYFARKPHGKNGSNGHYLGNETSLADIKTTVALEALLNEQYHFKDFEDIQKLINPDATPNLWKVREAVQTKKSYANRLVSDLYEEIVVGNTKYFDGEYTRLMEQS